MNLVEPEALLLRVLIGGCVVRNNTLWNLANVLPLGVTLKSKVKRLDLRRKRGDLSQKIGDDLRIPGGLIDVRANKNEAHCVYSLGCV